MIDFSGLLALVADNDPATPEALSRLLRTWGLTVIAASAPEDVRRNIEQCERRPHL